MIIQPHLQKLKAEGKVRVGEQIGDLDILELITFDSGSMLNLYINCFNESMRMQAPVYLSSSCSMSEDV